MQNPLKRIVTAQKEGNPVGIYSCCSANEYVLKAALLRAKQHNACVLIESTANQCDQYGGYTGMKPSDFKQFVEGLAQEIGLDSNKLFLGGDHLGPLTFASKQEDEAMKEAEELVRCYVAAGFTKIHIDTSMRLASDDPNVRLSDEIIAKRGARLAKVAEDTYYDVVLKNNPDAIEPVYIVGSEVPIPGGQEAGEAADQVQVTKCEDFKSTYATFEKAFMDCGLQHAWSNVMAVVVQPGVEEKDAGCTEYDREKAAALCACIKEYDNIIFEGHSTDYQTKYKLRQLVEDGVAILKVGPGLTFAMREALFALAYAEKEMHVEDSSHFMEVLDEAMLENPKYWSKHYAGTEQEISIRRKYSFSDRCRYYMPEDKVRRAREKLLYNLKDGVPLNLLSQFMPIQYTKVREGLIENNPEALIIDRVCNSIDEYLFATHQEELY